MSSYSQALAAGATSRPVHLWRLNAQDEVVRFTVPFSTAKEYIRRGKPFLTEDPIEHKTEPGPEPTASPPANPAPPELQPTGTAHRKPKSRARKARAAKAKAAG
jgi:hypothetical protein